jgi:electron transfer flavoprotein alpha subunit
MKTSDVIIAVNKDPEAPIFGISSLGVVGDLYEVVPGLIEKIKEHGKDA